MKCMGEGGEGGARSKEEDGVDCQIRRDTRSGEEAPQGRSTPRHLSCCRTGTLPVCSACLARGAAHQRGGTRDEDSIVETRLKNQDKAREGGRGWRQNLSLTKSSYSGVPSPVALSLASLSALWRAASCSRRPRENVNRKHGTHLEIRRCALFYFSRDCRQGTHLLDRQLPPATVG
jgi:hypothetical protein